MAKRRAQNMRNVTILELLIRGSEIANASEMIIMITFWNKSHWNLRKGFVWPLSPIVTKIQAEILYACVVYSTAIHPPIFSISCNMQDDICTVCFRMMFSLPIGNSFSKIISSKGNSWKTEDILYDHFATNWSLLFLKLSVLTAITLVFAVGPHQKMLLENHTKHGHK